MIPARQHYSAARGLADRQQRKHVLVPLPGNFSHLLSLITDYQRKTAVNCLSSIERVCSELLEIALLEWFEDRAGCSYGQALATLCEEEGYGLEWMRTPQGLKLCARKVRNV